MNSNPGFKIHFSVASLPFFHNFPNTGYSGDDPANHLPSIVEKRLTDLGDKYFLMLLASNKIKSITQEINKKYDKTANEVKVGEEYWELVLFLNQFLFEARSLLDILAAILRHLHGNRIPKSFNEIDASGKHAEAFSEDQPFHQHLINAKNSDWAKYLLSSSGKTSLRDRAAHNTVARISIFPHQSRAELEFRIRANLKAEPPNHFNGLELSPTILAITLGTEQLLNGFKENYSQKRIRKLLNIPADTPGIFEQCPVK